MDLIAFLASNTESETAVLQFQLEELQALRMQMEAINERSDALAGVIHSGPVIAKELAGLPPTLNKLARLVEARERIEAAVAELGQLQAEFRTLQEATQVILAQQELALAFGRLIVFA